jgi:uncharacterized protein YgbK (DUF1537 family)
LVPRHLPAEPAPQARRTLFVCGSISARSLEFIEASRKRNWPVVLMPPEVIAGKAAPAAQRAWTCGICAALPQHRHVLLGIGPPVNPGRRAGARLGNLLVDAAREVLMRCAPDRVCIEGGATAVLLLRRLGVTRLRVEHDFAMGVTAVRAANGAGPQIVVKPGSYPWPASLLA